MNDEEVERLLIGLKSKPKGRDAGSGWLRRSSWKDFDNYKTLKLTEGQILQFHEILLHFRKDQLHKVNTKIKR